MEQEQLTQFEALFKYLPVGIAILDSTDLCIRYLNTYISTQLVAHGYPQDVRGRRVEELLPEKIHKDITASLQEVAANSAEITYKELSYEGYNATRGRTYWRVNIKKVHELINLHDVLLITIEDITESVRPQLQLQAVQSISSTMIGAYALPTVLDRILQVLSELLGASASAVLLIAHTVSDYDAIYTSVTPTSRRITLAAQKGIHLLFQDWYPLLNEHVLFSRVESRRKTQKISDTTLLADINFPYIDENGSPCRPVSVISVPIFEPHLSTSSNVGELYPPSEKTASSKAVFGSIEVYYPVTRSFPAVDVEFLEQLSLLAGIAIQNARLFHKLEIQVRTERRKAHQQKYVMQAMPDGVIIFDPRWRIAEANQTIYTLLGWNDNVIGLSISEAFKQSKAIFFGDVLNTEELIPELERRAHEGIVSEFKVTGADAEEYIIRATYTPIQDEIGDIFAYIIVCHDVTELVEARERIEAEVVERTRELAQQNTALQLAKTAQETEQARLKLLLERLPSGVILVSAQDNTIITINQHAIQLLRRMLTTSLNVEQAATVGQDAKRLLQPIRTYDASGKLLTYEQRPLHLALKDGKANEAELHMQDSDDEMLYIFASAAPLRASDGTISSAVLLYSEITPIKKLEQARDDFFTTMAHELKTPLANVRAQLTSLLAKDVQWSPEQQYAALQTADEQLKRLISAVHRTLEVTRIEAGGLQLRLEAVLLPELFEDLEERFSALIASSQRRLHIVYPKALPVVQADYELIMSVLTNLLSNAFRYAPEGDTVLVEANPVFASQDSVHTHPISVTLCVSDNGPGLTQEQQKFLFKRFSTLSMTNKGKGQTTNTTTGLGLYISRGIVEAHGSKLTLVSSPGQGASFSFTLPTVSTTLHT